MDTSPKREGETYEEPSDILIKTKIQIMRNLFILKGWHERSCPAHTDHMQKEEDCDCIYSFVLEEILK